jgi:DNA-binding XRE family transcriptional regulator
MATRTSQEALAARIGVSDRILRHWEKLAGEPSLAHCITWAFHVRRRLVLRDRLGEVTYVPSGPDSLDWQRQEFRRWAALLKARRRSRGISQTDTGLIVGVSRTTLQRWEDGLTTPTMIRMLVWADRLDFTLDLAPDPNDRYRRWRDQSPK